MMKKVLFVLLLNNCLWLYNLKNRVVVIADNCQDRTAEIARVAGATVIERHNSDLKGKGYALDYGLNFLENDPPDVVIFVDADCYVESNAIDILVAQAISTGKPVQASYLMGTPPNPRYKDLISTFAFKVKNLVRFEGLKRLGLPCLLTGTGMAFPWKVIRSIDLASGHITEDMKLGMDLTLAGYEPVFCSQAIVKGYLPSNDKTATKQRTRWEHGHLQTLLTYVSPDAFRSIAAKKIPIVFKCTRFICTAPIFVSGYVVCCLRNFFIGGTFRNFYLDPSHDFNSCWLLFVVSNWYCLGKIWTNRYSFA